ncbi:putative nucleocapsid protein [Lilac chlorotic ringspot-associated virus]|uniref:Putative nucleocapsid protein n=1 Tax=Lilac chlorotic ringspot-associated virus TaxID=2719116 RepID=A0A6G8QHI4_9VIRU|nr:putative nucleocapsid protein [Lilac chlorotic ringspot-associated virus]QIN85947.1 putative nucleocapsid protein [Lilac chlorotic ringspot-associated virus]
MPRTNTKKSAIVEQKGQTSNDVPANSVKYGKKANLKTVTFTNVKDSRIVNGVNISGVTTPVFSLQPFVGGLQGESEFDITKYGAVGSVDLCATHLSNTQELKKLVVREGIVELKLSDSYSLFVCNELHSTTVENAVSFNRACAIMSLQILRHTVAEQYDWEKNAVVELEVKNKKAPNPSIVNRLAGQMRLPFDSPYYWMIVPGYEFLYDIFPIETIALTMVRLECRKALNIPDRVTNGDIVNSLVSKMNRRNDLTHHNIPDIMKSLGLNTIVEMYHTFKVNVGTTGREMRNEDAVEHFMSFIKQIGSDK